LLENPTTRLAIDLGGGAISEFRFQGTELNPLSWSTPAPGDTSIHGFGHFLCLDRWGPPSKSEEANGMPYHGEASHVLWTLTSQPAATGGRQAELTASLPMAGLVVRRRVRLSQNEALFAVQEEVTNTNRLGRIYNLVQHPTIAPPFLQESTVVDCNGRRGFAQGGKPPNPEEPSTTWPRALDEKGQVANLRELKDNASPNVVSYTIDDKHGWVTAATPSAGLLIGYIWLSKDYPWVSLWRDVHQGQPAARGLEFGTTGLHQPFPILVEKGRIWDLPLFEYLDAGQSGIKRYAGFLLKIPADFGGVEKIEVADGQLIVHERREENARRFTIRADGLIPE
jgi:hypothetical protein